MHLSKGKQKNDPFDYFLLRQKSLNISFGHFLKGGIYHI